MSSSQPLFFRDFLTQLVFFLGIHNCCYCLPFFWYSFNCCHYSFINQKKKSILVCFLLRGNADKKEALENLDLILLCLDEIVDGGYVICFFVRSCLFYFIILKFFLKSVLAFFTDIIIPQLCFFYLLSCQLKLWILKIFSCRSFMWLT